MQITDLPTEILYSIAVDCSLPRDTLSIRRVSKIFRELVSSVALKATILLKSNGLSAYLPYMEKNRNSPTCCYKSEHKEIRRFLAAKFPNRKSLVFHAFQFGDIETIKKLERELGKNVIIDSVRLIKKRAELYPKKYPYIDNTFIVLGYGDISIDPIEDRFRKLKSYFTKLGDLKYFMRQILNSTNSSRPNMKDIDCFMAYELSFSFDLVPCLIEFGADILKSRALCDAVSLNNYEIANLLIDSGIDINNPFNHIETALHLAAQRGSYKIAKLLVDNGININARDKFNNTALHAAAQCGSFKIVKLLLENGAVAHAQDNQGITPLHYASGSGDCKLDIVELLIEYGADINCQASNYNTALYWATEHGQHNIVKLLIEKGADVNAQTALHVASEKGQINTVNLLLENGANVKALNKRGWTTLHSAIYGCQLEIAKILLENNVDLNVKTTKGYTAKMFAEKRLKKINNDQLLVDNPKKKALEDIIMLIERSQIK